ncbi:MAG: glycosyltransferase family 4 protein [Chloroflexi bacterium]|nr:glycosyltransferase family 4 protein [Chloroflexota bacterium]
MRILFLADGRSPIARSWIDGRIEDGHEVHLVSSRAQSEPPVEGLASFHSLPLIPRPRRAREQAVATAVTQRSASSLAASAIILHWVAPLWIGRQARRFESIVHEIRPDLVHALRLPVEGMVALAARGSRAAPVPTAVSIWGNDFTLHAPASPMMAAWTRRALRGVDALHVDCERDLRLAARWGFTPTRPRLVAPGNGGIRADVFHPAPPPPDWPLGWGLPAGATVFVNPRGLRGYTRSDTFFKSIPRILREIPHAHFLCVGMAGSTLASNWVRRLGIEGHVRLLPSLTPGEMAELFQGAQASLSVTTHDGTPNTLLEAMACGCFPIAGDLASLREWIRDGENGLLVPPGDDGALAKAVVKASRSSELREHAAQVNARLVAERGDAQAVRHRIRRFYEDALRSPSAHRG